MSATNVYTSIACNRTPESADWGHNGLIAFAACNSIAILDPKWNQSSKIKQTFVEHTAKVNTVKWISDVEFLSGGYDKQCIHWDISDPSNPKTWKLIGHEAGVTFVDAICVHSQWTIATTSLDSTIRLWRRSASGEYETFDSINLGNGFCFAIRFAILPGTSSSIVMAVANDDNHIHLYSGPGKPVDGQSQKFTKVNTLVGHADWVRGLDFVVPKEDELLLASSSQDTFIRLWKISAKKPTDRFLLNKEGILVGADDIQIEEKIFTIATEHGPSHSYAVALESVLSGHDAWVYGVDWSRAEDGTLQLLSSSIDKTLIIWTMQEDDGVWMEKIRVGEVGGNSLGFYGGKFSPDGKSIFGHGFQGSFHIWHQDGELGTNSWTPGIVSGGHFSEVRDFCWDPLGEYVLSISADQTTRCHGPWVRNGVGDNELTWHELARPQVHGYDMQTVCAISRYRFASGAEEKIVRTFQAPANFVNNFRRICGIEEDSEGDAILKSCPEGASVPSLGLSNKAVYEETNINQAQEEKHIKEQYPENYFVPINLSVPPAEETLMQNTLWPEIQKLYGHGYEVYALAASSNGQILASSCKATNEEHAQIIIWNTSTWKYVQKLTSHQLTVTQMRFSPDNKYLLSVGRDRRLSVFENRTPPSEEAGYNFELVATTDKKNGIHGRIIWTCDWSHDSQIFGTGSRDAKVVVWGRSDVDSQTSLGSYSALGTLELAKNDSVTSFAFARDWFNGQKGVYLTAVGLETGFIHIYEFSDSWNLLFTIDRSSAHHLTVKKLAFRPSRTKLELASCGDDHLVRIYKLQF